MRDVGQMAAWADGVATAGRRLAADPQAGVVAAAALAVLAAGQALWVAFSLHASHSGGLLLASGWPLGSIVAVVPSLLGTLPLGFLWPRPAAAALTIGAVNFLSLAVFRLLPVAALAALLIVSYRAGRHGAQLLAAGLCLPFLALALANPASHFAAPAWPGEMALAILAAALVPATAAVGAALRSRSEAQERTAASEAFRETLLENTARGVPNP